MKPAYSIIVSGMALGVALVVALQTDSALLQQVIVIACLVWGATTLIIGLWAAIARFTDRSEDELRRRIESP